VDTHANPWVRYRAECPSGSCAEQLAKPKSKAEQDQQNRDGTDELDKLVSTLLIMFADDDDVIAPRGLEALLKARFQGVASVLSPSEWATYAADAFTRGDSNGDGVWSEMELANFCSKCLVTKEKRVKYEEKVLARLGRRAPLHDDKDDRADAWADDNNAMKAALADINSVMNQLAKDLGTAYGMPPVDHERSYMPEERDEL